MAEYNGGKRRMWLRQHRNEIIAYCDRYGEEATCRQYHMKPETLNRLLTDEVVRPSLSKVDKSLLRAEIAEEGVREIRKEVRELKEAYQVFVESVGEQLALKFFLPLLQSVIRLDDPRLEAKPDNRLSLDTLFGDELKQPGEPELDGILAEGGNLGGILYQACLKAVENKEWERAFWLHVLRCSEPSRERKETWKSWDEWAVETSNYLAN